MKFVAAPRSPASAIALLLLGLAPAAHIFSAENPPPANIPAVLLVAPHDTTPLDAKIRATQTRLATTVMPGAELEKLGWLFVAKARASSDPGYETLAGLVADALEKNFNLPEEAWLLRGHVLQSHHRFADAEALARRLVASRGDAADFALLGDALYDQGDSAGAAAAYQQFVNIRPGLEAYTRAANIRWLKGDLDGAVELQTMAVRAGSASDPAALAWTLVRLGHLVWAQGHPDAAATLAARANELAPDFPPALLLQGRLLLAAHQASDALAPLARAAAILPLPEPRWVQAEALRAAGREDEAAAVEKQIVRDGPTEDPRTTALFLATRGLETDTAVRLAQDELATRADVLTHGANALALAQAGRGAEAVAQARAALAENTVDARLLLQAGRAFALAHEPGAADLLDRAGRLAGVLLPSELQLLAESRARLSAGASLLAAAPSIPNTHPNEISH